MKHFVRVCRPRFEIALIEINASDVDDAEDRATAKAFSLPPDAWTLLPFDERSYFPHVQQCMPEGDLDLIGGRPDQILKRLRDPGESARDSKYLLLYADVFSGEGRLIPEPWFAGAEPELLETDLCMDWLQDLGRIEAGDWLDYDRWSD